LGKGGQWAAVAGFDGSMVDESFYLREDSEPSINRRMSKVIGDVVYDPKLPLLQQTASIGTTEPAEANVYVRRKDGGGIFVDDPSFLADWSVEGIALVRRHLFRAGNGAVPLPCESNWTRKSGKQQDVFRWQSLPRWASEVAKPGSPGPSDSSAPVEILGRVQITISDLPLLVSEVEQLLDVMEEIMEIQRHRRLDRLRPPPWIRINWYIIAAAVPSVGLLVRRLKTKGYGKELIKMVLHKVSTFFQERLFDPVVAM
jgi:hypothetical protein